jgi:chromosome condensin MukBEF complex kleisin-like MukF subunit
MLRPVVNKRHAHIFIRAAVNRDRQHIIAGTRPFDRYMIEGFPVTVMQLERLPFFRQAWFKI